MSRRAGVVVFSKISGLKEAIVELCPAIVIKSVAPPVQGAGLDKADLDQLQTADILLSEPALLANHKLSQDLPNLVWLQSTWAGVNTFIDSLDKNKPMPAYHFTKISGKFGQMIGEFMFGSIIAYERNFYAMKEDQQNTVWRTDYHGDYRTLNDCTLGILGFGNIGREVAKFAKAFGMRVKGVVRHQPQPEDLSEHVDELVTPEGLVPFLRDCDYLCNILPSTPQTRGLLNDGILANCQHKRPVFVNVGRGDVISDDDLMKALDEGWIRYAILDVFNTEPLPTDNKLWSHPRVTLMPHVSAMSGAKAVADVFCKNYLRYLEGESLLYSVDLETGY